MSETRQRPRQRWAVLPAAAALLLAVVACSPGPDALDGFAEGYAAAWSSQDPQALAAHYAEHGVLVVNDGEPAVGRPAIAAKARGFMSAFPDMVVRLDRLERLDGTVRFHWHWTGRNTGPGGNGRAVDLRGYEEWTLSADGLIERSEGHYDAGEYRRQLGIEE